MKKQNLRLLCLSSCLIIAAVIFSRCKKSTEDLTIDKNENQKCYQSEEDQRLEERILAFRDGDENARTTGQLDVEEAIWLIEATLNYTYGDNNPNYLGRKRDSITLDLDTLDIVNASSLYPVVLSELSKGFYADYFDSKKLTLVDLQLVTNGTKNDPEVLIVYYESGDCETTSDTAVFGDTDWWYYGFEMGKCNGYNDTTFIMDAAKMLQDKLQIKISADIPITSPCPNGQIYYTNITTDYELAQEHINPNDTVPNSNYYDFLFYYSHTQIANHHTCLSPDEMNWYYYSMYDFIKDKVGGNNISLKNIISLNVTGYHLKTTSTQHQLILEWGNYHVSCDNVVQELPDPEG